MAQREYMYRLEVQLTARDRSVTWPQVWAEAQRQAHVLHVPHTLKNSSDRFAHFAITVSMRARDESTQPAQLARDIRAAGQVAGIELTVKVSAYRLSFVGDHWA